MARTAITIGASLAILQLVGCTTIPDGPNVLVLPGTGKSFDQFRADDVSCRQFASSQVGGATASATAMDSGVRSAAVGTVLGAAAGAAINGGSGAGVGAGAGLAMGGLIGTSTANASAYGLQRRYDYGYMQCMYAYGHRVPASSGIASHQFHAPAAYQQSYAPPPPPGSPPPPPPSYSQ